MLGFVCQILIVVLGAALILGALAYTRVTAAQR